jgi:hypothetical protein
MLPPHAYIVTMKWKIHVANQQIIIHALGHIAMVDPSSQRLM